MTSGTRSTRACCELADFSHDLSALLAGDLEPHERQQLIEGLGADGTGQLEYEAFREVMRAIGAEAAERRGRLAALRLYGEDVGLARTALGASQSAKRTRHELRVAGAVVRVLQRENYRAEDAACLLPALGLPDPTETQLRAAFKVFDLGNTGELDGEYVREASDPRAAGCGARMGRRRSRRLRLITSPVSSATASR